MQTHTLPRSHRSSQGAQTISDPSLLNHVCLHLQPSFLFLLDAKGRKQGHAIAHLPLHFHDTPAPSAAGGKGRGEHRAGLDEQTMGTALPATGMRELPWP